MTTGSPSQPQRRRYTFCDDVAAYGAAARAGGLDVVPVLRPSDEARLARWREILRWYDATEVESAPAADGNDAPVARAAVVSVGSEHDAPAATLAAGLGLHLARCRRVDEVAALARDRGLESLVVAAPPRLLTAAALDQLKHALPVRWGFITGHDLAAASFMVAKQLLTPAASHAFGVVDSVATGRNAVGASTDEYLSMLAGDWESLVVMCHGEGSHLHLGSVVGCGLYQTRERHLETGAPIDGGCRGDTTTLACKRADAGAPLFAMHRWRVRDLVLLSCNGMALAGEHYPSTTSIALAAADGYVRSLSTTYQWFRQEEGLADILSAYRRAGAGVWAAQELIDEVQRRRFRIRPFVMLGCPEPSPLRPTVTVDAGGAAEIPAAGVFAVEARALAEAPVLAVDAGDARDGTRLLRGERQLWAVATRAGALRLRDDAGALARLRAENRQLLARLVRAAQLEPWLAMICRKGVADERLNRSVRALAELRGTLESYQRHMRILLGDVESAGTMRAEVHQLRRHGVAAVERWDATVAELFRDYLLAGYYDVLFDGTGERPLRQCVGACETCAAPLWRETRATQLPGLPCSYLDSCINCGIRELWWDGGLRLDVRVPEALVAGAAQEALVTATQPAFFDARGHVIGLATAGPQRYFLRDTRPLGDDGTAALAFTVPPRLTPDIRSIVVAGVRGLDLTIRRTRVRSVSSATTTLTDHRADATVVRA